MSTSLATLQQYRDEAVAARHALATGEQEIEVQRDGRRMKWTQASMADLNAYIDRLDREIADAEAVEAGRPRRGAIGFRWGGC